MNDTLIKRLCREYKHATRALRRLMDQDENTPGYGARFDELLDRCRCLRLKIEELEREGSEDAKA